jgi:hypothetical protein
MNDWHNEDHQAHEREAHAAFQAKVTRYCDTIVDAICSRIQEVVTHAEVEHIDLNTAPNERLLRVTCPGGVELWIDVSSPLGV